MYGTLQPFIRSTGHRSARRRLRVPVLIASVSLILSGWPATSGADTDETLARRIEAVVPENFSGQIAVGDRRRINYSRAFGLADREAGRPNRSNTLFDMGSITKTFTATSVLQLAAAGKVSLDQTLGHWFDDLQKETAAITLHQLLTHTSGLPLYSGDDDAACDRACFDDWLAKTPLEFSPGDRFQYSNPGYSALARIVEKASGADYETYLERALVAPLRLGPVGYLQLPDDASYAVGYYQGQRVGTPPELAWMEDGPSWHLRGNGGLVASANSLLRWMQATAEGRPLPDPWSAKQIERQVKRHRNVWYGYGWGVLDKPWGTVVSHSGGNGFFVADVRWFRDRDLFLAVTGNAYEKEQTNALISNLRDVLELAPTSE